MPDDVSIDLGSAVPYLVEEIKKWFGKDAFSENVRKEFEALYLQSCDEASSIQCIGMPHPIPIEKIYQRTDLTESSWDGEKVSILNLIKKGISSIIFAGPGDGKTTMMRWVFYNLCSSLKKIPDTSNYPILITLRWPNSVETLQKIITYISNDRGPTKGKGNIVLLIDGYDEIDIEQRKIVSSCLRNFRSQKAGVFYLTCRNHYDIIDLQAPHYWIRKFNAKDAYNFCDMFFNAYNVNVEAKKMIRDLKIRGFTSFTEHPLMLTLVCILYTTTLIDIPRSTMRGSKRVNSPYSIFAATLI
jgi:hypothetical protein